jgi:KUP system potassium uptake protein
MGHFGKRPSVSRGSASRWPALVLTISAQGAMLLAHPENVKNPFYEMAPPWAVYPLIGLRRRRR